MVQKIIWSPEALNNYLQILQYLQEKWTDREALNFADRVDKKIAILERNPRLGSVKNKKLNIHKTTLHKKVILIYKYKPRKKEIILLSFWNVQQDPKKMGKFQD